MEIAALIFAFLLSAAPLVVATILAHRMGRRGGWKVWPSVVAILFAVATWLGYPYGGTDVYVFLSIFAGGYVGCLALLLALVIVRAAPHPADTADVF
ncbi:hypothetical protein [Caulobacter sp. NIBR1757]|uniref:hypothetical protein n=1 Tax=Caulobacter sp. NIBR1757 TaxID=3016000 RepID=UPI0022F12234|nr:hypothetical protein [Caulobacter sp. NIBR1757]WGM38735.1 hypothetical protein AMEJIAPC_01640 [Caulobacter sp. NIBR1757]